MKSLIHWKFSDLLAPPEGPAPAFISAYLRIGLSYYNTLVALSPVSVCTRSIVSQGTATTAKGVKRLPERDIIRYDCVGRK